MQKPRITLQLILVHVFFISLVVDTCIGRDIELEAEAKSVGKYEKLELLIRVDARYDNPFDQEEVNLSVLIKTPSGRRITPVLIGEFGLADPKWGLSDDMKRDDEGVHFHNCL